MQALELAIAEARGWGIAERGAVVDAIRVKDEIAGFLAKLQVGHRVANKSRLKTLIAVKGVRYTLERSLGDKRAVS